MDPCRKAFFPRPWVPPTELKNPITPSAWQPRVRAAGCARSTSANPGLGQAATSGLSGTESLPNSRSQPGAGGVVKYSSANANTGEAQEWRWTWGFQRGLRPTLALRGSSPDSEQNQLHLGGKLADFTQLRPLRRMLRVGGFCHPLLSRL